MECHILKEQEANIWNCLNFKGFKGDGVIIVTAGYTYIQRTEISTFYKETDNFYLSFMFSEFYLTVVFYICYHGYCSATREQTYAAGLIPVLHLREH